jgi:hypothetical protein
LTLDTPTWVFCISYSNFSFGGITIRVVKKYPFLGAAVWPWTTMIRAIKSLGWDYPVDSLLGDPLALKKIKSVWPDSGALTFKRMSS